MRLVLATVLLRSLAAICAKKAAIFSHGHGIAGILINYWTAAEFLVLILQAILWSHVLSRFPLNKVYPFMSLVFGLNLAAAGLIFNEVISANHFIGIAIVIVGLIIVNSSEDIPSSLV